MTEGLLMLCMVGIVLSLILFVLIVRFLWLVPSSLRSISNCLWSIYDTYLDERISDLEDDFDDDEIFS